MRVTVNVQPLSWGHCGTRNYLQYLLPELARQSPAPRFNFVTDRPVEYPAACDVSRTIWPFQRTLKSRIVWEALSFPLGTMSLPADLIHIPFQQAQFWSRQTRVMTVHDAIIFEPEETSTQSGNDRFYFSLIRRAALSARVVLTVSEFSKGRIVELMGVDPNRVVVTPIATSPDLTEPAPVGAIEKFKADHGLVRPYILYVGGTGLRKNVPNLIRAYNALRPDLRAAHDLVIVGTLGSEEAQHVEARQAIEQLGTPGQVRVIQSVDQRDLAAAYSGATAFVFPSLYEGFGLSPLEAMGCGVPVLTSNQTSMPEVAGDAAILFDPYGVSSLAGALESVLENPELQAGLKERGLERAKQFTWHKTAELTMKAYQKALSV